MLLKDSGEPSGDGGMSFGKVRHGGIPQGANRDVRSALVLSGFFWPSRGKAWIGYAASFRTYFRSTVARTFKSPAA